MKSEGSLAFQERVDLNVRLENQVVIAKWLAPRQANPK